jgi:hypothetical protein
VLVGSLPSGTPGDIHLCAVTYLLQTEYSGSPDLYYCNILTTVAVKNSVFCNSTFSLVVNCQNVLSPFAEYKTLLSVEFGFLCGT